VSEHAVTEAKDRALEPIDKLDHGKLVAGQAAIYELVKVFWPEAQSDLPLVRPPPVHKTVPNVAGVGFMRFQDAVFDDFERLKYWVVRM
jgi:hypothetical protein